MSSVKDRYKVVIVAPTCFYYQVDLFRALSKHPNIDLTVYFCSDEALKAKEVQQMYNTTAEWGNEGELLDGYRYKFLRNYSPFASYLRSIVGLLNFGIWQEIKSTKPDVVLLMSWMNPTWWLAVMACRLSKVPFLYLTDANVWAENTKAKWKTWGKRLLLGKVLFKQTAGALCAGTANRLLYSYYGIPDEKLFPFAYSWGYEKLIQASSEVRRHREQYRKDLGIAEDQTVIMFCGRLSEEKGLSNLIEAYGKVASPKTTLMFVGDGNLRQRLEDLVAERQLPSVKFMGFQDRNEIQKFFTLSDLLVLPSLRETWGIVVNEGLCFSLPAIVSDEVGAGVDLVQEGHNGFTFPAGDSEALGSCLERFINLSSEEKLKMGTHSFDLISRWSERDLSSQLVGCLETINLGKE